MLCIIISFYDTAVEHYKKLQKRGFLREAPSEARTKHSKLLCGFAAEKSRLYFIKMLVLGWALEDSNQ